ncbi:GntR family transcriptional regulator [Kribbella sp. NPDC004875]|uniref:GntR family transcriptional regulator n=1 Tax=Kribbella sp. NPDC004875 TaxID=3364107 RepID=UPI0036C61456
MVFRAPRRVADQTRRIHDLLRASIIAEEFGYGSLPSEEELRAEFDAPRACVREALTLLEHEGLIVRVRGRGTFVASGRVWTSLREMHGIVQPTDDSIWHGRMRTQVLDWSEVPLSPPVARLLGRVAGDPVLRIDYVAVLDGAAIGGATNYVRFPEAGNLERSMLRVDFYEMLRLGGIAVARSTFRIDTGQADEHDTELFDVDPGAPMLVFEQIIYDDNDTPVDVAFCRTCASRTTLFSRAGIPAEPGGERREPGVMTAERPTPRGETGPRDGETPA